MLKELPEDPYGYVIAQMEKVRLFGIQRASIDGVFIDVEGWESFSGQGFVCLKLKFKVEFMSQEIGVAVGPLGILSD